MANELGRNPLVCDTQGEVISAGPIKVKAFVWTGGTDTHVIQIHDVSGGQVVWKATSDGYNVNSPSLGLVFTSLYLTALPSGTLLVYYE